MNPPFMRLKNAESDVNLHVKRALDSRRKANASGQDGEDVDQIRAAIQLIGAQKDDDLCRLGRSVGK